MHNSSHTHILAGCWCSPQTNQDSLFLSLPTCRLFCFTSKMGEIKKKKKALSNLFTRVLLRMCVCVLSFHLKSILNLAYRCSTDDATPVLFFFFSLFPSLWNYQKIGWTSSWWWLYSLFLTPYVIIKRRSIIVRLK